MRKLIKVSMFSGMFMGIITAILLVPYFIGILVIDVLKIYNCKYVGDPLHYWGHGIAALFMFSVITGVVLTIIYQSYKAFSKSKIAKEIDNKVNTYEKKKLEKEDASGQLSLVKIQDAEGRLSFADNVLERKVGNE